MTQTLPSLLPALRLSARYARYVRYVRYAQYARHLFCLAALVALALALPAQAVTKTWDGTTGNWSDDTKWSPAGAPLATDDAVVDAGSVTLTAATTVASLSCASPGAAIATAGFALTINTVSNNDCYGIISGTGVLIKQGTGTATLFANNTYNGATTVSAGTLVLYGTYASPSYAIASGAVLELNSASGSLSYVTTTFSGSGTLRKTGGNQVVWNSGAATFTLGAGSLIDVQAGSFVGASGDDEVWTSNLSSLNVAAGALFRGVEAAIRVDALTGSGTVESGFSSRTTSSITVGLNNGTGTFSGTIQNSTGGGVGRVIKRGTGTQTLSGANTYTGLTTVSTGTLVANNASALGTTALGTIVSSGATLALPGNISIGAEPLTLSGSGISNIGALSNTAGINSFGGAITLAAASSIGSSAGTLTLSGAIVNAGFGLAFDGAGDLTASGEISGTGSLVKTGAGTAVLSAVNIYSGVTTVSAGTLRGGLTNAFSSTSAITVATGAVLDLGATSQTVPSVSSTGTLVMSGANLTLGKSDLSSSASSIGTITGTGTITLNPGATLTLTSAQSNAGLTIVLNGGTLNLGAFMHSIGTLSVTAASTLDFYSAGNAQLTVATLTPTTALTVTNWTQGADHFYATAVTGTTTRDTLGTPPNITLTGSTAAKTVWLGSNSEITLLLPPTIAQVFSPTSIMVGASSTLTITLTNPNVTALTNAAFTNTYPAGLVNFSTPAAATTCTGGTVTAAANGTSLALSAGTIAASSSCTVTVNVTSSTAGTYTSTLAIGAVTNNASSSNAVASTASLAVSISSNTFWDGAAANTTAVEGGTGPWNATTNNWTVSDGSANGPWPAGSSVATFAGTAGTATVSGTQSIGGLTFNTTGYTVTGGTLTGAATTNPLMADTGISASVASILAGSNAFSKEGAGTLTLSGASTYSGATNVNGGTLNVQNATALGTVTGGTSVASGAALELQGSIAVGAEALTLSGTGVGGLGALRNVSGTNSFAGPLTLGAAAKIESDAGTLTLSGTVTNAGFDLTLDGVGNTTMQGVISGSGGLIKNGLGALSLTAVNTFTGTATIHAGTLFFSEPNTTINAIGGDLVINGATVNVAVANAMGYNAAANVKINAGGVLTTSANVTQHGDNKTFTLAGGTMTSGTPDSSWGSWDLSGGASFLVTENSTLSAVDMRLGQTSTNFTVSSGKTLTNSGNFAVRRSSTGGFTKLGAGTMIVSGNNTHTGAIIVGAGTLNVQHASGLGTTAGGVSVADGAALELQGSIAVGAEALTLSGTGVGALGALRNVSGTNSFAGAITLGAAAKIESDAGTLTLSGSVGNAGTDLTLDGVGSITASGVISGSGGLVKAGAGTVILSGANLYGGATTVSAGVLQININSALPAAAVVSVAAGATFNLNSKSRAIVSLASAGTLAMGTGGSLTLGNNSVNTLGAVTGSGTITVGSGATLTLTAALSNTGVTIVLNGGTLNLGLFIHSIGVLSVSAASTLDFSNAGNAQLTVATLTPTTALTVTNWSQGADHFYATAINPAPAKDTVNALSNITFTGTPSAVMAWYSSTSELNTLAPPTVSLAFSPANIATGANSTLTITLTNPNATTLTTTAFTNTYPTGLVNAATPAKATTCTSGTVTAVAGAGSLALSAGTLPASASCTVSVSVTASTTAATYTNTLAAGAITSSGGSNAAPASASLTTSINTTTFWDGAASDTTTIEGGAGTWDGTTANWTVSDGSANASWAGGNSLATFSGAAGGAVTVSGTQSIGGLSFTSGGYSLSGGILTGANATNTLSVSDTLSATVANVLAGGSNAFNKDGGGTLILSGANTYTGATTVSAGVLTFQGDFASSGLAIAANAMVVIDNTGALTRGQSMTISGTGTLRKTGIGTLSLSPGAAVMAMSAGSLIDVVAGTATLGNDWTNNFSSLSVASGATFMMYQKRVRVDALNGAGELGVGLSTSYPLAGLSVGLANGSGSFSGVIRNSNGSLQLATTPHFNKYGTGTQILSGLNTYTGATAVNAGILQLGGATNTLPYTTSVSVASGATLDLNGKTQSVVSVTSTGTMALGSSGSLTLGKSDLTSSASSIGTVSGTGTITVGPGATLTLTSALTNPGLTIVLAGGTLNLGLFTHSIGTLSVSAASTLDFANAGNAQLTVATLTPTTALTVTNWSQGADHFYATAINPAPAKDTINALSNITFTGTPSAVMAWYSSTNELSTLAPPSISQAFSPTSISAGASSTLTITLINPNATSLTGAALTNSYPANLFNAASPAASTSCTGGSVTAAAGGTSVALSGATLPASSSCTVTVNVTSTTPGTYTSTLAIGALTSSGGSNAAASSASVSVGAGAITGRVFLDTGAGGGTANDGIANGTEPPQAGITVSLSNCAGTAYSTSASDGTGNYTLAVPTGTASGAALCVEQTNLSARLSTGASVGSTALPSGTATAVGGVSYTYSRTGTPERIAFAYNGASHSGLNFADVDSSTFAANGSKTGPAGNGVTYLHTFTAQTAGSVTFSVASSVASPALAGWSEKILADAGCTGTLQAGAAVLYPGGASTVVSAGQQVCVIVQEFIPGTAQNGYSNAAQIQASMTLSNASPALSAAYVLSDTTQVSSSALELKKEVRNVTQNVTAWGINNQAKSGETLQYRITYTNNSTSAITALTVNDATPSYTTFVSAGVGTTPAGLTACQKTTPGNAAVACGATQAVGGTGTLAYKFTGTLNPSDSGSVVFDVKVD